MIHIKTYIVYSVYYAYSRLLTAYKQSCNKTDPQQRSHCQRIRLELQHLCDKDRKQKTCSSQLSVLCSRCHFHIMNIMLLCKKMELYLPVSWRRFSVAAGAVGRNTKQGLLENQPAVAAAGPDHRTFPHCQY